VITGVHALVFSGDDGGARAFFRDKLGFDSVDAGGGWLIFALPPAELATHDGPPHHELYLMCDEIHATVDELKAKGVSFCEGISEERWGLKTMLEVPGGGKIGLYEPRHVSPLHPDG
jgi:catechol 2,3-dioxygenase-like lactoylglutathione lyase family enzyme